MLLSARARCPGCLQNSWKLAALPPSSSTPLVSCLPPSPQDAVASDLARATGLAEAASAASNRLNKIVQLTGFSDPIYAEAYVTGEAPS